MEDDQIKYRINEIFRLVTELVTQGKEHGQKLDNLTGKFEILFGQITEIGLKVIEIDKRLFAV